jgi:hypothetical protein
MAPNDEIELTIRLSFAFDLGYAIDLDRARPMLQGQSASLPRRRRTPESIRYRPEPLRVALDVTGLTLPQPARIEDGPRAELSLFDFGAISLGVSFRIRATASELRSIAGELADSAPVTTAARIVLEPWLERIKSVVVDYEPSMLSEEYVLFIFDEIQPGWLDANRAWIASLVRLEPAALSESETQEATRLNLSYAPNDLVVLDWAAGLIADSQCADTIQVIEFANVQLLEYRHIDDRLDDRLEAAYQLIRRVEGRRPRRVPWRLHADAVRNVRELEIEATSLFERVDNGLKLVGDQYLSRVFGMASQRFHLEDWQKSIRRKLETVGDVYDLLTQQASGTRLEILEIVVILLIALEIVLAFVRH